MSTPQSRHIGWLGACLLALLVIAWPTVTTLHSRWTQGFGYTHGYLVIGMALWLLRHRLKAHVVACESFPLGLIVLVPLVLAFAVAQLVGIDIVAAFLLPVLVVSVVLVILGRAMFIAVIPALLLAYFAIPIWDVLTAPLQAITTAIVGKMLLLHDFPTAIDGYRVSVPAGEFEVAGGCSGLSFLVVSGALATYLAFVDYARWRERIIVFGLAVAMALITNWIRVYALIVVGQWSDMQHYLITTDHYFFGWVLFAVLFVVFLFLIRSLPKGRAAQPAPINIGHLHDLRVAAPLAVLAVFVVSGGAVVALEKDSDANATASGEIVAPDGWSTAQRRLAWQPVQRGADVEQTGRAEVDGEAVEWYAALYRSQSNNREVMAYGNRPYARGWVSQQRIAGPDLTVELIRGGAGERLVAWRAISSGRHVVDKKGAKLAQIIGLLAGDRSGAFVAVSMACDGVCGDRMDSFGQQVAAQIESFRFIATVDIEESRGNHGAGAD